MRCTVAFTVNAAVTASPDFSLHTVAVHSYYTHYRCQVQSAPLTISIGQATLCRAAHGEPGLNFGSQPLEGSPFELARPDPALCAAACNSTDDCAVWVYHAPNCSGHGEDFPCSSATGAHGCCFLKAREGTNRRAANPCNCGGLKGGGKPPPAPPSPSPPGPNPDPHALVCSGISSLQIDGDATTDDDTTARSSGPGSVKPMWNALDFRNGSKPRELAPACNASYEDYSSFVPAYSANKYRRKSHCSDEVSLKLSKLTSLLTNYYDSTYVPWYCQ